MPEMQPWKYDRSLTAAMVEDFIFDPILASKVILGLQVPPHEELRLMWMWTTYYTNDDSGFSTGKSFSLAIISALRSILFPGRVSGILSKTFSQGKLIFANIERWCDNSPIFKGCIKHVGSKPRIVHGNDVHAVYFKGGSEIRVLPPNFLQDAERLRGERWNDGYFDEWVTFGRFEAFNKTIVGRVTRDNMYQDCPIRQNHIHLCSTPDFKHNPAYKIVRTIDMNMAEGNNDYSRFTCNYRHIPATPQWRWLVNRKVIHTMQTTLPKGIVKTEVDGLWQDDSMSYYSAAAISETRFSDPEPDGQRDPNSAYVAGFDVARGGGNNSSTGGDDFSISVFRISKQDNIPVHVATERKNGCTAQQMSGMVHKLHRKFSFSFIVYDQGGGGLFVKDELRKNESVILNERVLVRPIVEINDTSGAIGDSILIPFARGAYYISQMWSKMQSESVPINRAHEAMKIAVETKKIVLAREWSGWEDIGSVGSTWDIEGKRASLNKSMGISQQKRTAAEMSLAVEQLILVDVERRDDGTPRQDSFGMYKFGSREKKDSAYSLIYAHVAVLIWNHVNASDSMSGNSKKSIALSASPI